MELSSKCLDLLQPAAVLYTQLVISYHFCGTDIQKQSCFVTTHRNSDTERGKADQRVYEETHIPSYVSLLFLHVTVVSLAALGYTMTPLARGQTEFPNKRDPSSPDCEVVVWRVDVKLLL